MTLFDYIKGQRRGKDAHHLERESMQDPFLSDAIDGFDSVESGHIERIEELRRRVSHKTRRSNHWFAYAGIAASFLMILTVGGYFMFKSKPVDFVAKSEYQAEEKIADKQFKNESVTVAEEQDEVQSESEQVVVAEDNREAQMESEAPIDKEKMIANRKPVVAKNTDAVEEIVVVDDLVVAEAFAITEEEDASEYESSGLLIAEQSKIEEINEEQKAVDEEMEKKSAVVQGSANRLKSSDSGKTQAQKQGVTLHGNESGASAMPEPKIGWEAYGKYLVDSLRYPSGADCEGLSGSVIVSFLINEKGNFYDFEVVRGLCDDMNKEAIRLIKEGCLWTHKSAKRVVVSVRFRLE